MGDEIAREEGDFFSAVRAPFDFDPKEVFDGGISITALNTPSAIKTAYLLIQFIPEPFRRDTVPV